MIEKVNRNLQNSPPQTKKNISNHKLVSLASLEAFEQILPLITMPLPQPVSRNFRNFIETFNNFLWDLAG